MSIDENGNFKRNQNWKKDKDLGIAIITSHHDDEDDNFEGGINDSVSRDTKRTFTANVNFANHKAINVGSAQYNKDAPNYEQLMTGNNFLLDKSNTKNKIEIFTEDQGITMTALKNGQRFFVKCKYANTDGNVTIKVNNIMIDNKNTIPVVTVDGLDLAPDAITAGGIREFLYYDKKFYAITGAAANTLPLLSWFMTDAKIDTTEQKYYGYALQGTWVDGKIFKDAYNKLVEESKNFDNLTEAVSLREYNKNTNEYDNITESINYKCNKTTKRRFYTLDDYELMLSTTGGCMGYVIDEINQQFRLPINYNFVRGETTDTANANSFGKDQIQNITGQFGANIAGKNGSTWNSPIFKGAFTKDKNFLYDWSSGGGENDECGYGYFNASLVVATGSQTQPRFFRQYIYYIVGNTIVNYGKIDLTNISKVAADAKASEEKAKTWAEKSEAAAAEAQHAELGRESNYIDKDANTKIFRDGNFLIIEPGLKVRIADGRDEEGDVKNFEYVTPNRTTYLLTKPASPVAQILCLNADTNLINAYAYYNHNETFEDADLPSSAMHALWFLNSTNRTYKYTQNTSYLSNLEAHDFFDFTDLLTSDIKYIKANKKFIIAVCAIIYQPEGAQKPISDIFVADKNNPIKWYKNHLVYENPVEAGDIIEGFKYNEELDQFYIDTQQGNLIRCFIDGNEYEKTQNLLKAPANVEAMGTYKNFVYYCYDHKAFISCDYGKTFKLLFAIPTEQTFMRIRFYYNPDVSEEIKYGIIFFTDTSIVYYSYSCGNEEVKSYMLPINEIPKGISCGTNIIFDNRVLKTNLFYTTSTPTFHNITIMSGGQCAEVEIDNVGRVGFSIDRKNGISTVYGLNYDINDTSDCIVNNMTENAKELLIVGTKLFILTANNKLKRIIITPFEDVRLVPVATFLKTEQDDIISLNLQNNLYFLNAEQIKERLDGFIRDISILKAQTDNAILPTNPPPYQDKWLFGTDDQKRQIWISLDDLKTSGIDIVKKMDYTRIISMSEDNKTIYLKQGAQLEIAAGLEDNGQPKVYPVTMLEDAAFNCQENNIAAGDYLLIYIAGEGNWKLALIPFDQFQILNHHPGLVWDDEKGIANYPDINSNKSLIFSKPANYYYYKNYDGDMDFSTEYVIPTSDYKFTAIAADQNDLVLIAIENDMNAGIIQIINADGTTGNVINLETQNFAALSIAYGNGVWLCGGWRQYGWAPLYRCTGDPSKAENWSLVDSRGVKADWESFSMLKFIDGIFYGGISNTAGIVKSTDNGASFVNVEGDFEGLDNIKIVDIIETPVGLLAFDNTTDGADGRIFVYNPNNDRWGRGYNYSDIGISIYYCMIKYYDKMLLFGEKDGQRVCFTLTSMGIQPYELPGSIIVKAAVKKGNSTILFGGINEWHPSLISTVEDEWREETFEGIEYGHGQLAASINDGNDFIEVSATAQKSCVIRSTSQLVKAPIIPIAKLKVAAGNIVDQSSIVSIQAPKNYPAFIDYIEKEELKTRIEALEAKINI